MKRLLKWLLGIGLAGAAVTILIMLFLRGRQEAVLDAEQENPPEAPSRLEIERGQAFIVLDRATQAQSGIQISVARATEQRSEVRANAVVLSVQGLTELRNTYLAGTAQVDRAKAALAVSRPAYERLQKLYEDNQNAAAKAVQEAEGAWHSDEVSLRAANDALQSTQMLARQAWGEQVAQWLVADAPVLDRVLSQQDLLLQVSFLPGTVAVAPETASLQAPDGKMQLARFVSAYPSVDPRIQGPSFLYVTAGKPDLVPGMSLVVVAFAGPLARGIVVPENAVVWWQGKPWVYVQIAADRFARREVPAETPVAGGFFAAAGFAPGDKLVVRGGQQLLSEEFRSQIQVLSDSE
jgi:hypothetical protein